jgi:putative endonuclease
MFGDKLCILIDSLKNMSCFAINNDFINFYSKMNKKIEIGKIGEDLACIYLINKGYQILERNYKKKFGEIDIIVETFDKILVFIEVKTLRRSGAHFSPEDNFTTHKINRVKRMAEFFVAEHPSRINEELGWRIDLIAIEIFETGSPFSLRHYENI